MRTTATTRALLALAALPACLIGDSGESWVESNATQGVFRAKLLLDQGYLEIEILDDDLVHVELGTGQGPATDTPIATSPMVFEHIYRGPTVLKVDGRRITTAELVVESDTFGCLDIARVSGVHLTRICAKDLGLAWKGIAIDPSAFRNAYGLGQYFRRLGSADGDQLSFGRFRTDGDFGNHFRDFYGGADPQLQFPILYAVGDGDTNAALFLDNVYKQDWDFADDAWWQVRMFGDQVRYYVMSGPDVLDLRRDYMELVGKPPVPPKKAFGLWLSEFGFDNWGEIDGKLAGLRDAQMPVDGMMLDLQWFGGAVDSSPDTPMGGLAWSNSAFPDPAGHIRNYAQQGVGIIPIEESYVGRNRAAFGPLAQRGAFAHRCDNGAPIEQWNWMGDVGMIDWSDSGGAAWWHDNKRQPNLIALGVMGHWTDLGEPERYDPGACYRGVDAGKNHHGDIHNLYNLLWHQSIWDGYIRHANDTRRRPFLLARAGTSGIQRFGAAMWSGDIASRLDVLATHQNSAMHMSLAGIDYYGSDVGGFWRRALPGDTNVSAPNALSERELYTQWFANSAWFDIPLRPHTFNCGFANFPDPGCPYEVSPAKIGSVESNRANLTQRYELIPYYYSLAHEAYETGSPVISPLVTYFQRDPQVRQIGHERMVGRDLLVGIVASHGEGFRSVYLPAGTWVNYHTGEYVRSTGQWTGSLPIWRDGILRLPTFARAGAILPMMFVDGQTRDAFGGRRDGTVHDELVVKVFAAAEATSFTLREDDGANVESYDGAGRPHYRVRTTAISQQLAGTALTVTLGASAGDYPGGPAQRNTELRVVTDRRSVASVTVNGQALPQLASDASVRQAGRGFCDHGDGTILVRTGVFGVAESKTVVMGLR
jgi:alpha-glucosidase (family GH31 glycosyl hydrolase)